ncbi:AzlD domain-containing protein [Pseudonocardia sp.]|uniref:AzlD domain-containing protein n=1 Tax=Pseudonocardia sp. TaxID=60912 RepID=UPI003D0DF661
MSAPAILVAVLAVGVASYLMRIAAITLLPASRLPAAVRRALGHAGPAAIAAMVGAGVAAGVALPELAGRVPVLAGAVVAGAVAWRWRGLVLPVVAGLATVAALSAVL